MALWTTLRIFFTFLLLSLRKFFPLILFPFIFHAFSLSPVSYSFPFEINFLLFQILLTTLFSTIDFFKSVYKLVSFTINWLFPFFFSSLFYSFYGVSHSLSLSFNFFCLGDPSNGMS